MNLPKIIWTLLAIVIVGAFISGYYVGSVGVVSSELAKFKVSNISVSPDEIIADPLSGVEVTISVTVTNTGKSEGTYTVVLEIDGVDVAENNIFLKGGESIEVSFSVVFYYPENLGPHHIEIGEASTTINVLVQRIIGVTVIDDRPPDAWWWLDNYEIPGEPENVGIYQYIPDHHWGYKLEQIDTIDLLPAGGDNYIGAKGVKWDGMGTLYVGYPYSLRGSWGGPGTPFSVVEVGLEETVVYHVSQPSMYL